MPISKQEQETAVRNARIASAGQSAVTTTLVTGGFWALLATYFHLSAQFLGALLGGGGACVAVAASAANDEETEELQQALTDSDSSKTKPPKVQKLKLKSEAVSASMVLATIIGFAAKPLAWLADVFAWPLAFASAGIVAGCTWWKNRQHKKLRQSLVNPPATTSPEAAANWEKLGPELQAQILDLERITFEKVCGAVVASIFGAITGAALYAIFKTFGYLAIAAFCPPLFIVGVCLVAISIACKFYKKFIAAIKAAVNKSMNELRALLGIAPQLSDNQTKSSTSTFLMGASTFLSVLALITNPILKIWHAIGAAVNTAFVYFMTLVGIKRRAARRVTLVAAVKAKIEPLAPKPEPVIVTTSLAKAEAQTALVAKDSETYSSFRGFSESKFGHDTTAKLSARCGMFSRHHGSGVEVPVDADLPCVCRI